MTPGMGPLGVNGDFAEQLKKGKEGEPQPGGADAFSAMNSRGGRQPGQTGSPSPGHEAHFYRLSAWSNAVSRAAPAAQDSLPDCPIAEALGRGSGKRPGFIATILHGGLGH